MEEDWRLCGQERYLMDKELYFLPFVKYSDTWDHEHCAFCWARFSDFSGDLHEGYCTESSNSSRADWICPECYNDFKDRFRWKLHR